MKKINEYINENAATITAATLCDGSGPGPIDELIYSIKSWWHDKKAHKIIDKIVNDPEIMSFFDLPKSKQKGNWVKLLKSKLSEDEYKYIYKITKAKVQNKLNK